MPKDLISIFTPAELELLSCGMPEIDRTYHTTHTSPRRQIGQKTEPAERAADPGVSPCLSCATTVDDLQANTEYFHYRPTDKEIMWFWNILRSFSQEHKALFLQFVTGAWPTSHTHSLASVSVSVDEDLSLRLWHALSVG